MTINERNMLVEENLGLIDTVINFNFSSILQQHNPLLSRDDLFQEGAYALIGAAESFDPVRDTSFQTYAITVIKSKLLSLMEKQVAQKRDFRKVSTFSDCGFDNLSTLQAASLVHPSAGKSYTKEDLEEIVRATDQIAKLHTRSTNYKLGVKIIMLQIQGFTTKEICEKLGITPVLFTRARTEANRLNKAHRQKFADALS